MHVPMARFLDIKKKKCGVVSEGPTQVWQDAGFGMQDEGKN